MTEVRYLDYETVVAINANHGGAGAGVRDEHGIRAALGRAESSFGGLDVFPSLADKAAAILHGLSSTQCFHDGNKRTAWIAAKLFLAVNGHMLRRKEDVEAEAFVLSIATGAFDQDGEPFRPVNKAAEWYRAGHRKPTDRRIDALLAQGAAAQQVYPDLGIGNGLYDISGAFMSGVNVTASEGVLVAMTFIAQLRGFADDAGRTVTLRLDIDPEDSEIARLCVVPPDSEFFNSDGTLARSISEEDLLPVLDMPTRIAPAMQDDWQENQVLPNILNASLDVLVRKPGRVRLRLFVEDELARVFNVTFH